ncbi:MAG TPA: hypothetical protein VIG33_10215 [Pseudobdellovibrionaceae bacterium]
MSPNSFLVVILSLALFGTGCTKSREAELPANMQASIFAITEFGDIQTENSQFSMATDDTLSTLSLGNSSKATAEKGVVALTEVNVPGRLKYMFSGLTITGLAAHNYPVTFSVDRQFVTAYKVVTNPMELTILEKQLAQVQEEVLLQKQLQKNKDKAKSKELLASLQKARTKKLNLLSQQQPSATLLVPIFKFKVLKFGVIQKEKNKLKEDTSTLELLETDWTQATHIQIGTTIENRLAIGLDPAQAGDLDRTFVMDRINNKIMTAETLRNEYQIPLNLDNKARVLTLLDTSVLHVFEITQLDKVKDTLSDAQLRQLQSGVGSNVRACPADVVKALPADAQKECLLILRYDVDVTYVRPEQGAVDYDGNLDSKVDFKPVLASQNIGLVQVPKDVIPKTVEANNTLDPRSTIRIIDIKDKEFFFKRTLEDASYSAATSGLAPGMAGAITIVKFDLQEDRVVIRRADKIINYKTTSNDSDYEELMSLPVKYVKLETKDASGAAYAIPHLVPATRKDAQYINLDWTANSIPQENSPYAAVYEGCTLGIADTQVADVDMRLDKGVLNFSQKYSLALKPECSADFSPANGYNGTPSYQYSARVIERVSFKVNDGSTDKPFVTPVPFKVQNTLGYGVWTIGQINPDIMGQFGREGTETDLPMVQDFRNGKVLTYTLTGLPTDDAEMRKMYIGIAEELAAAWNLAYKQAFKGSALERSGNYIEIQIAGENGVTAHLGDLDKNIFHFENKYASHGILGVSQVGFNPRSAIVVADSLILYTGNVKSDVANSYVLMNARAKWEKMKQGILEKARKELATEETAGQKVAKGEAPTTADPTEGKAEATKAVTHQLISKLQSSKAGYKLSPKIDLKVLQRASQLALTSNDFKTALKVRQTLGNSRFAYSPPIDESGWMDRVFQTMLEKPDMSISGIHGAIAKEVLASKGNKLSQTDRASLARTAKQNEIKAKMLTSLRSSPGCMKTEAEVANAKFANLSFNEAFRIEALNTMVHEMGHSQGLTHNFIGSYDKANYANEDGTPSKRNYSSVMDYLTPGHFSWDGLGTYDIHAVRASHLGLLEIRPEFKAKLGPKAAEVLVNDKYISIQNIKAALAKNGWANFTKADAKGVLKEYKFCTDVDVGWDPMCQRHDFGSSVTEVVQSIKEDWENNYISNYYSWDRNSFGMSEAYIGSAWSQHFLMQMRKYMDETFYKMIVGEGTKEERKDYINASLQVYLFYNQLITTPDTNAPFLSAERFVAVPYSREELNDKGEPTGKEIQDVALVEKRSLNTINRDKDRIDTRGIEFDKIAAMRLMTMKGFPSSKYESKDIEFSFLDFEKYFLGMTTDTSQFINTLTSIMLDHLEPTFTPADGIVRSLAMTATITETMRQRAGIYGILNLETPSIKDKDNFANLFKVGSSVGNGPSDRTVLTKLDVSPTSSARVGFWALDNATVSQYILNMAAEKNFFIQKMPEIQPAMEKLIGLQLQQELSKGVSADKKTADANITADVEKARTELIGKLHALNTKGDIVSADTVKNSPKMSIESQVDGLMSFNSQVIVLSVALVSDAGKIKQSLVDDVAVGAAEFADISPLAAIDQKALLASLTAAGKTLGNAKGSEAFAELDQAAGQLVTTSALESSYGIIMKNIEFLNLLTSMTNPEYSR